ncbi:MAG: RagB/SusD family nutrient uptake outer membrane protein [Bacteroidota bacterium]|nr:RagB/SusD family nutrient uptake outer membrane protein [Bacteroidota bacterium]
MKIKYLKYLLFAMGILITSCKEDYLDTVKEDSYTSQNYWQTTDQAKMYVTSCYNYIRDEWWKTFLTCATDDSYSWSDWPSDIRLLGNGTATASSGTINHFWSYYYQAIATANIVHDNIGSVPNMDETLRKRLDGEARFFRDYAYQQLIGLYGDVPLIDHLQKISEFKAAKTPKADVVKFIVNDIDAYSANLPLSYADASDQGRVTRGAALALKARVLLYDGQWVEAAKAAKAVMDLGVYSIDPNYSSLFDGTNESSKEIILAGQYVPTSKSSLATWVGGPYVGGWSQVVPTQALVDAYECTDGKTIDQSPLYNPQHPYDNRDPRLKMTIVVPGSVVNGITIDVTNPTSPYRLGQNNASYTAYYYKKYTPAVIDGSWDGNSTNDIIVLRYAEVLLTYAEAKIEANDIDASVYNAINQVRQRASVNQPPISSGKSQTELRSIVRRERRIEFAIEEQRLFDIRRWKIAENVMPGDLHGIFNNFDNKRADFGKNVLVETRIFNPARDYVWGYPQGEVDLNKNLVQNPKW